MLGFHSLTDNLLVKPFGSRTYFSHSENEQTIRNRSSGAVSARKSSRVKAFVGHHFVGISAVIGVRLSGRPHDHFRSVISDQMIGKTHLDVDNTVDDRRKRIVQQTNLYESVSKNKTEVLGYYTTDPAACQQRQNPVFLKIYMGQLSRLIL